MGFSFSSCLFSIFSYRSRVDSTLIEYKKFCDEIESIFTTDFLEKNPLVDSEPYVPIRDAENIQLDPDKQDRVDQLMNKLAQRVKMKHFLSLSSTIVRQNSFVF